MCLSRYGSSDLNLDGSSELNFALRVQGSVMVQHFWKVGSLTISKINNAIVYLRDEIKCNNLIKFIFFNGV